MAPEAPDVRLKLKLDKATNQTKSVPVTTRNRTTRKLEAREDAVKNDPFLIQSKRLLDPRIEI
jgi:ribosomal protein L39E